MKTKSVTYLAFGLLVTSGILMAADTPKTYTPTEIQTLRLQVKQRDAQLAQQNVLAAQEKFQAILAGLQGYGEAVRVENKWPDTVKFDPNTLSFTDTAQPVPAAKPTPIPDNVNPTKKP